LHLAEARKATALQRRRRSFSIIFNEQQHHLHHLKKWMFARMEAAHVYLRLIAIQSQKVYAPVGLVFINIPEDLRTPLPDARFFNAALDVFGQQLDSGPRYAARKTKFWRKRTRKAVRDFLRKGLLPRRNSDLLQVLNDMMAFGYELPLRYHELVVGAHLVSKEQLRAPLAQIPYAFPSQHQPQAPKPYHLHVLKTRAGPPGRSRGRGSN